MHNQMSKIKILLELLFAVFLVAGIFSCRKEEDKGTGPSIQFKLDSGYIYKDETVLIGKTFNVGIIANKGDFNITDFIIKIENDTLTTYLDTGLNAASLNISKTIIKGLSSEDKWTFIVRDKAGNSASLSFNIYADTNSAFGPVITVPSIILGAQNNTTTGSFLDIKNVTVYNLQQAYGIQDSIEILYYYDAITSDANTIASPNANIDASVFPGTYGLSNWIVKNETRYLLTTLTDNDFTNFNNDSLLIGTYNETLSKRKAKNLAAGLPFRKSHSY